MTFEKRCNKIWPDNKLANSRNAYDNGRIANDNTSTNNSKILIPIPTPVFQNMRKKFNPLFLIPNKIKENIIVKENQKVVDN